MKTVISALLIALSFSSFAQLKDGKFIVDYKTSSLNWKGQKVTGSGHNGTIRISSGVINIEKSKVTNGKVKVDMNSISNTDLTDAEYNAKLVNHLKAEDFFNTTQFPDAQFEITSVTEKKDNNGNTHEVKGKITIKGKTEEIAFPAVVTSTDKQLTINGGFTLDRSKFDVRYGSETFFGELGDNAISNEMILTFSIIANK